MQTGIPLVGLIFGVVPIFTTAKELALVKALSSGRSHYKLDDFLTNLHYELSLLQMNLEKLVNELAALHVDEKEALKKGSNQSLWTDQRVYRAVEDRLGAGCEAFQIQVTKLVQQLEKLVHKDDALGLQGSPITAHGVFSRLSDLRAGDRDLLTRFRFHIKEEKLTKILEKVARYNCKIATLLDCSTPSSIFVDETIKRPSRELPHSRLRPLMHHLHKTMGKLWPCECGQTHQARLCLLECPESSERPADKVYFSMLTSVHNDASDDCCKWAENKIGLSVNGDFCQPTISKVKFVLNQPSAGPSPPNSPTQISRSFSGLTFVNSPPTPPRKDSDPLPPNLQQIPIGSFHKEASSSLHPKLCARWLFDGNDLYKTNPSRDKLFVEASHSGTTLADLLLEKKPFSLRERRILAVILAHSLLHFCDSAWLNRNWGKNDLSFFNRTSKNGHLDIRRPWLSANFEDIAIHDNEDDMNSVHKNPSVFALGILLLEMETLAGIEESRTKDDLSPSGEVNCYTNIFTAERLLQSKCDDVFERFRKAVEACLNCDFVEEGASMSLNDDDFRQAVYENIVAPLEEELEHGFYLKPEDLGLERC